MTLNDELKILDGKIKANQAQYDSDREAGDGLRYKTGVVEKAKLEYSPLGKVFKKGLEKGDNKEGLLKWLNILKSKIKSS